MGGGVSRARAQRPKNGTGTEARGHLGCRRPGITGLHVSIRTGALRADSRELGREEAGLPLRCRENELAGWQAGGGWGTRLPGASCGLLRAGEMRGGRGPGGRRADRTRAVGRGRPCSLWVESRAVRQPVSRLRPCPLQGNVGHLAFPNTPQESAVEVERITPGFLV